MIYFFPSNPAMVLGAWRDDGTYTDETWPTDAVEVTDKEESTYWLQEPPVGKTLGASSKGRPVWIDVPKPSFGQLKVAAFIERDRLLQGATIKIAPLQDAVDLGEATAGELDILKKWKQYRVTLSRIDQQAGFPETIIWPETP